MTCRVGFIIEQTLGHMTHQRNLEYWAGGDPAIQPTWLPIPYWDDDRWASMPIVRGNTTLQLSLRARDRVRDPGLTPLDAIFYHTQSTALFAAGAASQPPTIVSLDATPLNMDTVATGYGHQPDGDGLLARLKLRLYRRAFRSAAALTTWSLWAKESLVRDYGVTAEKVEVIPPGVNFVPPAFSSPAGDDVPRPPRLLFVGGDFRRKGGMVLMDALRLGLAERCALDVVTSGTAPPPEDNRVRVHRGLTPGDPTLLDLFAQAELFILPTLADCTPIAILEAMAAGLAVVASNVGAISEQVVDGETGLLVPPGDPLLLAGAVASLLDDPERRRAYGVEGRRRAMELFNGRKNYGALLGLIKRCVDERGRRPSRPAADTPIQLLSGGRSQS